MHCTGSSHELISRLATQRSVEVGETWHTDSDINNSTQLQYSYRVVCDANYYGPQCADHCKARDDKFGHYTCGPNGEKVCLDGWQSTYCDKRMYLYIL